jgi:hypothetical protein
VMNRELASIGHFTRRLAQGELMVW